MRNRQMEMQRVFTRTVLSVVIGGLAAAAHAQDEPALEEVVVTGMYQQNLENARNFKRDSDGILDAISAEDIGGLPALDLGEALQVVPGVQLNREGERRESSINLRGLPSGFVSTTANGQMIAAPTRGSQSDLFGAPSPFGAYDPSIFNGISVIKTQDASMQEGGIAGTVDLRLPSSLTRDNGGAITVGGRYEELAEETDTEIAASGNYHIIEDVLAVSASVGYSEQNWRRDSVRAVRYNNILDGVNYNQGSTPYATLAEWKDANGVPENASVTYPGEVRQGSEINSGDRLSIAANIEYQPTDALKFGASYISTDRDMDDNRYEQIELRSREYSDIGVTPMADPINTGVLNEDGGPVYMVPGVALEDTRYFYDNRQYNFYQESEAIILDAEWRSDNWTVSGAVTHSEAENTWDEILISPRAESDSEADAYFYSGLDDVEDWEMQVTDFDTAINFDEWVWDAASRERVTNSGAVPTDPSGNVLLLTGTYDVVENDMSSAEIDFERIFEDSVITEVAFGLRTSKEEMDSWRVRVSGGDVDPTGIFTEGGKIPNSAGSDFFNGDISGAAGVDDGWYSFDFDSVNNALQATIRDDISTLEPAGIEQASLTPNGYLARANELGKGYDFTSEMDIYAAYLMADFAIGDFYGNFGMRYVDTNIDTVAPTWVRDGRVIVGREPDAKFSNDYDHWLPSINANYSFAEDLILRGAYNKTIVRPNMRAANPESRVDVEEGGLGVEAQLPGTYLEAFEADSFDLSLEWYNGDSGLVSLAYYYKEIDNYFARETVCTQIDGYDFGELSFDSASGSCTSAGGGSENLVPGAPVNIEAFVNTDATITVQGMELSVQQKLDFLPYPWNGFGGIFNYSYTDQDSDAGDGEEVEVYGISDNSYNVVGYYEAQKWGVRLAYNWRSDYDILASNTLFGEGVSTVEEAGRLDLAAYYHITDNFTLRLKGYNLTEEIYEEYQDTKQQMRRADFEGRTWVFSAAYDF